MYLFLCLGVVDYFIFYFIGIEKLMERKLLFSLGSVGDDCFCFCVIRSLYFVYNE